MMDWHDAYLTQARSEHGVFRILQRSRVAYSHQLHYLQMVAEKLSKAILTPRGSADAAPMSHVVFVRMLQRIKVDPDLRKGLNYYDRRAFRSFIDSLFEIAGLIERLSPEQAGLTRPNPEYPWRDPQTGDVLVPVTYAFAEFDPKMAKMVKITRLLEDLLTIVN